MDNLPESSIHLISSLYNNTRYGKMFDTFLRFISDIKYGKKTIMFGKDYVVMDWKTYRKMMLKNIKFKLVSKKK